MKVSCLEVAQKLLGGCQTNFLTIECDTLRYYLRVPSFKKGFYPLLLNKYFHLKVSKEIENYFLIMIQLLLTSRQSVWWNLKLLCKHCLRDVYTYVRLPSCRRGRRQYLGCRISSHVTIKCHAFPIIILICSKKFQVKCKNWKCKLSEGFSFLSIAFIYSFSISNHFWMKRSDFHWR